MSTELAYKRKARLRGKNRKLRLQDVAAEDNLWSAQSEARKGKSAHKGVKIFDEQPIANIKALHTALLSGTYHTSPGHECMRLCPCGKVRRLHKLPFYPDHVEHHALMRVIMSTLNRYYYYDSAASIKGKGIHFAAKRVRRYIDEHRDRERLYFVKLDFVKFYQNIRQNKCYAALARLFSDKGIRYLLREVITACDTGLGIGLYPIQPIANFYLCAMEREVMAEHDVRLFVYCDDIVVIGEDKREVWAAVNHVLRYAAEVLEQPVHGGYGMQIVDDRHFLDFVGYCFYRNRTLLRRKMKQKFARRMKDLRDPMRRYRCAVSYKGWLLHCDGFNLWTKVMTIRFADLNVPEFVQTDADGNTMLDGIKMSIKSMTGRPLLFNAVSNGKSKLEGKKDSPILWVQVEENGNTYKFSTGCRRLMYKLQYCADHDLFPFEGVITTIGCGQYTEYDIQ